MVLASVTATILVVLLFMDAVLLFLYWFTCRRTGATASGAIHRRFRRRYLVGTGLVNAGIGLMILGMWTVTAPGIGGESPLAGLESLPLTDAGLLVFFVGFLSVFGAVFRVGRTVTRRQ